MSTFFFSKSLRPLRSNERALPLYSKSENFFPPIIVRYYYRYIEKKLSQLGVENNYVPNFNLGHLIRRTDDRKKKQTKHLAIFFVFEEPDPLMASCPRQSWPGDGKVQPTMAGPNRRWPRG